MRHDIETATLKSLLAELEHPPTGRAHVERWLRRLAAPVRPSHGIAVELWDTGHAEAMFLSCLVEEAERVTAEQIDWQVQEIDSPELATSFAVSVVARTPFARSRAERWLASEDPIKRRCGHVLLAELANDPSIPDSFFAAALSAATRGARAEDRTVRDAALAAERAVAARIHHAF